MTKEQLIALVENKLRYVAQIYSQNSTALAREQSITDAISDVTYAIEILINKDTDKIKEVKTKTK